MSDGPYRAMTPSDTRGEGIGIASLEVKMHHAELSRTEPARHPSRHERGSYGPTLSWAIRCQSAARPGTCGGCPAIRQTCPLAESTPPPSASIRAPQQQLDADVSVTSRRRHRTPLTLPQAYPPRAVESRVQMGVGGGQDFRADGSYGVLKAVSTGAPGYSGLSVPRQGITGHQPARDARFSPRPYSFPPSEGSSGSLGGYPRLTELQQRNLVSVAGEGRGREQSLEHVSAWRVVHLLVV